MTRLMADPFLGGPATGLQNRRRGLTRILDWLERQPGDTWQDRWLASAADTCGNQAWRRLPMREQLEIDDGARDSEGSG